ncbi:MAG: hypothetical protein AAF202_05430, partial [Pseudomonadota bacterium]
LSLSEERLRRERSGTSYLGPRDALFDDELLKQLNTFYLYGLIIARNKQPADHDRVEAVTNYYEVLYMGSLGIIDFIRKNYQPELYEEALSVFLKIHFLAEDKEFLRIRDRLGIPPFEMNQEQRTALADNLPAQVNDRPERDGISSFFQRSVVKEAFDNIDTDFANLVVKANLYKKMGLFDDYNERRNYVVLTMAHHVIKLNTVMQLFSTSIPGGLEELSYQDLKTLHLMVARVEVLKRSPGMAAAYEVPWADFFRRQAFRVTLSDHRSERASLQVYWLDKLGVYTRMYNKEIKELRRHLATLEAILPEEERYEVKDEY